MTTLIRNLQLMMTLIRNLQLMTTLIKTKIRFIKFFYNFYTVVIIRCFLKENLKLHLKLISIELIFMKPHGHFIVILFSPDFFV